MCRHEKRNAIELASSERAVADVATAYGLSETALERHLAQHPRGEPRPADEDEAPATSRSPGVVSGVIRAATPDLCRVRTALVDALADVDELLARERAEAAA